MLRPGGSIVYSTCSSEPEENEDVVAAIVREGTLEPGGPDLRTLPFTHGLEAFFAAVLRKP
jgi:16S rRNA (cytosine967-C5)-methyltransferase